MKQDIGYFVPCIYVIFYLVATSFPFNIFIADM